MRKILTLLFTLMLACTMQAQKDVTTFLGIPVDGFKTEMRKKLIAKGFTPVQGQDYLKGEFNGTNVHVYIVTNNNKVYRIMLCDANMQDEANIKIRFNKLVSQFKNNKRYTALGQYTLSDSEDISYEMNIHKKYYDAMFYQNPNLEKVDTTAIQQRLREEILTKYTEEQLKNPTDDMKKDIQDAFVKVGMDLLFKKPVWFRIIQLYGEYYIAMFYDNEYNRANGEDL